jgi:thiol-disulfide isomerase/thioredoxin
MSARFLAAIIMTAGLVGCRDATPAEPEPATKVQQPAAALDPPPDAPTAKEWNFPTIKWSSPDMGLAQMRAKKRPSVVVVMATWCPQCDAYKALFRDPEVIELSRRVEMILIDADKTPERAAQWHTDADYFPRTFFTSPSGAIEPDLVTSNPQFAHFFNAVQKGEFVARLRQLIAKYP